MEHFGTYLKNQRETKGLTLGDVSRATKIKESSLRLLEEAKLDDLPAPVFVRGFVSAFARLVGADEEEALRRYRSFASESGHAPVAVMADAVPSEPLAIKSILDTIRGLDDGSRPDPTAARRRVGTVMVVLLILVVATLTLSLLFGHGGSTAGIS